MISIHGHTIEESIVTDGVIIDIGCRGFEFSNYFNGKKVYCIDPDEDVFKTPPKDLICMNLAISDKEGDAHYKRNGEYTSVGEIYQPLSHMYFPCKTITMKQLYDITGENVDLLKLDCEGAEYIILGDGFIPIPKQITVEFHNHTVPDVHIKNIDKVMNNLLAHYNLVYQHETGMDNLFIKTEETLKLFIK